MHAFSVDNVAAKVADPLFVGQCAARGAEVGNKVVWKARADEKVGVVARYWPEDWARMSPRLRQQTLAEGLEFVCADEPPHTEAPPQSIAGYTPKKPGSARRAPLA